MNLPNKLTVSRIILTLIFVILLCRPGLFSKLAAAFIFTLASLTDFFDGYYAKKHNIATNFGKLMDPIADKFLILAAFFVFALMHLVAWWMFIVIFIREIGITIMRLMAIQNGKVLAAEKWGKYKTVFQIITIGVILLYLILQESRVFSEKWWSVDMIGGLAIIDFFMIIVVILTVGSGLHYLLNTKKS